MTQPHNQNYYSELIPASYEKEKQEPFAPLRKPSLEGTQWASTSSGEDDDDLPPPPTPIAPRHPRGFKKVAEALGATTNVFIKTECTCPCKKNPQPPPPTPANRYMPPREYITLCPHCNKAIKVKC